MPVPPSSPSPIARLPEWDRLLPSALFVGAFVVSILASTRLGPVDGEGPHLEAATGYGRLIEAAHHEGLSSVTRDDVGKELGAARSFPLFPHGVAGLAWLALARRTDHALTSELFALRLPALLAAAVVPALVYLLAREALTRRGACGAAMLAFLGPRLLVDDVSLGGGAPLVAASLLAVWAHRVADRTGAAWAAGIAGLSFGVAIAQSFAPLLLLVVPVVHAWQMGSREAEGGVFRLSRGTAAWLLVGAPLAYLCSPSWQPLSTDVILRVFERTLSPMLTATRALGRLPTELAPPRWHALEALLLGVPSSTLVLSLIALGAALGGIVVLPPRQCSAVRWAAAHVALLVLWPALVPRALGSYPWAWQLAVPFLAIAAAHGAWFLVRFCRREALVVALSAVEPVVASVDLASAPAASGWLVRAPDRVKGLAPFDGAITGSFVPVIAELAVRAPLGRPLRIYAPDIAADAWELLRRFKRLPRGVSLVRTPTEADLLIATPDKPAPPGSSELWRTLRGARTVLIVYRVPR